MPIALIVAAQLVNMSSQRKKLNIFSNHRIYHRNCRGDQEIDPYFPWHSAVWRCMALKQKNIIITESHPYSTELKKSLVIWNTYKHCGFILFDKSHLLLPNIY